MFSTVSTGFRWKPLALAITTGIWLSACSVTTEPLDPKEIDRQIEQDRRIIQTGKQDLEEPIGIYEAMARSLTFNLDGRLKLMEHAMASGQFEVSRFDMLPRMAMNAGYAGRTNTSASSSYSIISRQQSLEPSTSLDNDRRVADLTMVWNVLDFGVAYYSTKQAGDRAQIADERRRKVMQNTLQEVNSAYWRAVAAERLLTRIDPLMQRIRKAQADSEAIAAAGTRPPVETLSYQKALLETLTQLESQRKALVEAKTGLAALIGLPPGTPYRIQIPNCSYRIPDIKTKMETFEDHAFNRRPELREERYNTRISALETRKAIARMFPGIEFSAGAHYDSNSYLDNNRWGDYGAGVTWNLTNLFSGPANVDMAEAGEKVAEARRQALSMAVLTQLYVARANYEENLRVFLNTEKILSLDKKITTQQRAAREASRMGDLALIQSELSTIQTALSRDLMYADLQNAFFKVYVSAGADVSVPLDTAEDIDTIAKAIESSLFAWEEGELEDVGSYMIPDGYCDATIQRLKSLDLLPEPPQPPPAPDLSAFAKMIQFDTASANLTEASEAIVARVAEILKANPTVRLAIEAHTDNAGSDAINIPLSAARAKSVVDRLTSLGIAADRLTSEGFGSTRPSASNDTVEGRATNRRVEMRPLQ